MSVPYFGCCTPIDLPGVGLMHAHDCRAGLGSSPSMGPSVASQCVPDVLRRHIFLEDAERLHELAGVLRGMGMGDTAAHLGWTAEFFRAMDESKTDGQEAAAGGDDGAAGAGGCSPVPLKEHLAQVAVDGTAPDFGEPWFMGKSDKAPIAEHLFDKWSGMVVMRAGRLAVREVMPTGPSLRRIIASVNFCQGATTEYLEEHTPSCGGARHG